jgi:hypothetical protein
MNILIIDLIFQLQDIEMRSKFIQILMISTAHLIDV